MTRILITGNSHVACIKRAWEADAPDFTGSASFFALPDSLFTKAKVHSQKLFGLGRSNALAPKEIAICKKLNGTTDVDLSTYDFIVQVGAFLPLRPAVELAASFAVDGISDFLDRPPLSQAAFRSFCRSFYLSRPLTLRVPQRLKAQSVFISAPIAVQQALGSPHASKAIQMLTAFEDHPQAIRAILDVVLEEGQAFYRDRNIIFISPPAETRTANGMTKDHFSTASEGLFENTAHDKTDFVHMNDDYGGLIVSELFRNIENRQ